MIKIKVVFLDRDGVINKYPGHFKYVTAVRDFKLLPNVKNALQRLTEAGFKIFIVSNQAGVSKSLYSHKTLGQMNAAMLKKLGKKVVFSGIYYCTHLKEADCPCRKPKTGLIDRAFNKLKKQGLSASLKKTWFIGDSIVDVQTGKNAKLKTILVFSGREKRRNQKDWSVNPDFIAKNLSEAVDTVLKTGRK